MSKPARPRPDGAPPTHKIQCAADELTWMKARRAMRRNGVNTVSALVGVLLSREFERLGLTDELVLAEAQLAEAQARAAAGATGRVKAKVRRKAKRVRS